MCSLSGSLTCRLPNVMRSPPARRSRKFNIKMTNSLRLTHHVLLVRGYMFRSLVTIIRPFCESILKMLDYILGSQVCLQFVPMYISVIYVAFFWRFFNTEAIWPIVFLLPTSSRIHLQRRHASYKCARPLPAKAGTITKFC